MNSSERPPSLPKYCDSLSVENKKIYYDKLKYTAGIDPYSVSNSFYSDSMEKWPEIEFPDIVNYLLFTTSRFTKQQLKAYKSLESYQYFIAGWVRSIHVGNATEKTIVLIGKVNHSQRLSEPPLKPWLAVQTNGTVLAAHCNCIAWLGEVCSHIGAILFAVEAGVRMIKTKSCTSVPCKWLIPTAITNVPYAELREIDFTAANTKKRKLDDQISGLNVTPSSKATSKFDYVPSQGQVDLFLQQLNASGTKSAILSLVAPYSKHYVPNALQLDLPKSLDGLYDEQLTDLAFSDLLAKAGDIYKDISCTKKQAADVELSTIGIKGSQNCGLRCGLAGLQQVLPIKLVTQILPNLPSV